MSTMEAGKRIASMERVLIPLKLLIHQRSTSMTENGTKDTSKARETSSRVNLSIQVPGSRTVIIRMGSWYAARRMALEGMSTKGTGS